MYYTRNSYKVTYKYEGTVPTGASELPAEATYKYGESVTVAEDATAPGYTFSGWDKKDFTMPANDVVIKGSFAANDNTQYKVEHYLEDLDDKTFTFNQAVASTEWQINHGLNKYPSVTIVDSGNNIVIGDIEYIDKNNVKCTFSSAFSGSAYLN